MVTNRPVSFGIATPVRKPHFSGDSTTQLAQERLLSVNELKASIEDDLDTYVGQTPEALFNLGVPPNTLVKRLDWLAENLVPPVSSEPRQVVKKKSSIFNFRKDSSGQQGSGTDSLKKKSSVANLKQGQGFKSTTSLSQSEEDTLAAADLSLGDELRLAESGAGIAGKVFRLTMKGKELDRLALKIFKEEDHNVYRETATGMFFTAQPTKDMSALYMAHPQKRWTLMEFIGPDARLADRPGQTMLEQGYQLSDSNAKNYVNGIRVDHGGIVSKVNRLSEDTYMPTAIMTADGFQEIKKPMVKKIKPITG